MAEPHIATSRTRMGDRDKYPLPLQRLLSCLRLIPCLFPWEDSSKWHYWSRCRCWIIAFPKMCVMLIRSLCHSWGCQTCFMPETIAIAAQLFSLFENTISHHVIKLIEQANFSQEGGEGRRAGNNNFGFGNCHSHPDRPLPLFFSRTTRSTSSCQGQEW